MNLQRIPIALLVSSAQPRPLLTAEVDKLAASIKQVGLIEPIIAKSATVVNSTAESGWQIIAGHHRVAACRALGWAEIDAIVIDGIEHLQAELMEIDENLCRAELTAAQRTAFTKRRKQAWGALHPTATIDVEAAVIDEQMDKFSSPVKKHGRAQEKGFAAATAEATGQHKTATNRALAIAEVLGDDLEKVTNTSLDKGVELAALMKLPVDERKALVERAVAGETVSARKPKEVKPPEHKGADAATTLKVAYRWILDELGVMSVREIKKSDDPLITEQIDRFAKLLKALK